MVIWQMKKLQNFSKAELKSRTMSSCLTKNIYSNKNLYYNKAQNLFCALLYKMCYKSEIEGEGFIEEVKDYLGEKCDSTDTSYSYVIVVKMGEKKY